MPLSRRYTPEWAPNEEAVIGMDFSFVIPPGVGIDQVELVIRTNTANPQTSNDFTVTVPPAVQGRTVYATLAGGVSGTDYQLQWIAFTTDGAELPRTALLLCAPTS